MISLSLRPTAHPKSFQPQPVGASSACYRTFTLAMGRSSRFGSTICNSSPCSDSLSLRLHLIRLNLALHTVTRRLIMQKARSQTPSRSEDPEECPPTACKHAVSGTLSLPSSGYFSPFPHGTCSLSVTDDYLALEDGSPRFLQGFTCPAVLGYSSKRERGFAYRTITFFGSSFQRPSATSPFFDSLAEARNCPTTPTLSQR